jgi:hypothetical protein
MNEQLATVMILTPSSAGLIDFFPPIWIAQAGCQWCDPGERYELRGRPEALTEPSSASKGASAPKRGRTPFVSARGLSEGVATDNLIADAAFGLSSR